MEAVLMTTKAKSSKKPSTIEQPHSCSFCEKAFRFETHLIKHMCRLKKRFLDRDRQHARYAYMAYRIFYDTSYPTRRKSPTQEDFEKSSVYDAFVKFGQYIIDMNAISPEEFIRFVIASKSPVDRWCNDKLYMEYVRALNKVEDGPRAMERNIRLMMSWAMQKEGRDLKNFFREISPALAVQWLMSGRISPWVIFNCQSGEELLGRLNPEQYQMLSQAVDIKFWTKKFEANKEDVRNLRDFLSAEGW
jgi:hypothetical protein